MYLGGGCGGEGFIVIVGHGGSKCFNEMVGRGGNFLDANYFLQVMGRSQLGGE